MLFSQLSMIHKVTIIVMKVMLIKGCFHTQVRNTTYIYPLNAAAYINKHLGEESYSTELFFD